MLYNLKIALRNIRRNGVYSVINIGGLAIGMAAAMLIMLWVYNQWSYDRFHEKEKQLYWVWSNSDHVGSWRGSSKIIGPTLVEDYADIINMTRYTMSPELITYGEKKIYMDVAVADPGFLTMFSFPLLQGDINTVLNDPHSIVLTKDAAVRIFGDEDPIGKDLIMEARDLVKVTGVLSDLPNNTRFKFAAIRPYLSLKETGRYDERWSNYSTHTYVELQPGAKVDDVNLAIKDVIKQHTNGEDLSEPFLYPVDKWYLYSKVENKQAVGGLIETVRLFSLIALLVLFIACINFMNLSTARSTKRVREVGVRKVMGAQRGMLVKQFLGESILIAAIAAAIATVMVWFSLPFFNTLVNGQLNINVGSIGFWATLLVFVLFTGILAGSYPAFYLSSFLPVKVLKDIFKSKSGLVRPRQILIITQFTFAIILIVSTMVIHRQIQYAQDRNTGYSKDHLIYVHLTEQMDKNQEMIHNELLRSGTATSVTRTMSPMTDGWNSGWGINWPGKDPEDRTIFNRYYVDAGWAKTTGITILQGRDIDVHTYTTDSTAMLLNEAAVKIMGFGDPIGQLIQDEGKEWHVIGVVKDFVIGSPYEPIPPMVIGGPAGWFRIMNIRLNGDNRMADNLTQVEQIFKTYNSDFLFEYTFVDESYARKFSDEQRTGALATWFAGFAIFISCLGLFGLSAYMAENRRKEIGVRKVLGASVRDITSLLSREFLVLVLISLFIAIPIAWLVMNKWLTGYSYRTNIPWWLFAVVALLVIDIALFTVSWQAIKAARTNPINSIKTE